MTNTIKLNGVSVDVEEAREAVAEFDAREAEKLYDGLTLEQWRYVKEGKFRCEFWNCVHSGAYSCDGWTILLDRISESGRFHAQGGSFCYQHCRPAQVYGLRHPCFGKRPEWLKDDDRIIYFAARSGACGTPMGTTGVSVMGLFWDDIVEIIAMPAGGKIE